VHNPNPAKNAMKPVVEDGDIIVVDDGIGQALLSDFPQNFFEYEEEKKKEEKEIKEKVDEVKKTIEENAIENAPDKMVTEKKPQPQKRKKPGRY
jgi:hypothetical protein